MASAISLTNKKLAIQANTERTFVATWKASGSAWAVKTEAKVECQWSYTAGEKNTSTKKTDDLIWYDGSSVTVSHPYTSATYSPPDNAKKVRFRLRASYTKSGKTQYIPKNGYTGWSATVDIAKTTDYGYFVGDTSKGYSEDNKPLITFRPEATYPLLVTCNPTRSKKQGDNSWIASYEVHWDFWNGAYWSQGQSSTPQTKSQVYVEYDGQIPQNATKVKATVIPTSGNSGVVAKDQSSEIKLSRSSRTVDPLTFSVQTRSNRTLIATWGVGSTAGLTGFRYNFQAWDGQMWSGDSSGDVDIDNISSAAGASTRWSASYSLPEGAIKARVRVLPVGGDNDAYIETWSSFKECEYVVPPRMATNISLSILPGTRRTVVAQWDIADKSNIASFEYQWSYKVFDSDIIFSDSSGSVNFDAPWNAKYDVGVNVRELLFEVKPIPKYESAFVGVYDSPKTMPFSIPKKKINKSDIQLVWPQQGRTDRTMVATWTFDDDADVENYECKWRYYMHYDELGDIMMDGGTSTVNVKSFTFTVPEKALLTELSIRPVPEEETDFAGEWSDYIRYEYIINTRTITNLTFDLLEDTERTMMATWGIDDPTNVDSYTYEYRTYKNEAWFDGSSATVTYPAAEFDAPSGIETIQVRVKPVDESGSESYFKGEWSEWAEYAFVKDNRRVEGIKLSLQRGSTRTVVAVWEMENRENVTGYDYKWRYYIDGIWYDGTEGTASDETLVSTYDAPEAAEMVQIKIRPIPKYERNFVGDWSDYEFFVVPGATIPAVPSVPSVTIDKYNLTAQIDTYDDKTSSIEFEVVDEQSKWAGGVASVELNRATYVCVVDAGHTYRVRARGVNENGETSEWSEYSSDTASFPAAVSTPPEVSAISPTTVQISWEEVPGVNSYTIEYATKSRYFDAAPDQVKSITIETGTRAEIIGLDSGETWFFRIRSTNSQGDSEWTEPVWITVGTTPSMPTTWSSTTAGRNDRDVYLYWIHNSEDASAETEATLELTVNGESQEIVITRDAESTNTSNYKIEAGTYPAGAVIKWRVKTKGVMPDYGDYSTLRQVNIYAPPAISVMIGSGNDWSWDPFNFNEDNIYEAEGVRQAFPDDTVTSFPMVVFIDSSPQTQTPITYTVSIVSNEDYEDTDDAGQIRKISEGQEIYSKNLYYNKHTVALFIMPGDINFEDGISYTLKATVTMNSGLSAETSYRFVVDWDEANNVYIDAELRYDSDSGVMYIRPDCVDEEMADIPMAISIYRIGFDGELTEIVSEMPNTDLKTVTDPHPSLKYAKYRIACRSERTGNIYFYDVPSYEVLDPTIIIQWDENVPEYRREDVDEIENENNNVWRGSMLRLPYNVDESESNTLDVEMINYIGRKHPVSYYGTHVGQTASWKTDIPKSDTETIEALRRLAAWPGDAYVRSPSGAGYWANVSVSFDINHLDVIVPVSFSITRVDGGM